MCETYAQTEVQFIVSANGQANSKPANCVAEGI
jgi:hypothetical protein